MIFYEKQINFYFHNHIYNILIIIIVLLIIYNNNK